MISLKRVYCFWLCPVRLGMQIANVKHSHCEAKFGFRVWETKFGCVHRKTAPTGSGWTVRLMRYTLLEMVLLIVCIK